MSKTAAVGISLVVVVGIWCMAVAGFASEILGRHANAEPPAGMVSVNAFKTTSGKPCSEADWTRQFLASNRKAGEEECRIAGSTNRKIETPPPGVRQENTDARLSAEDIRRLRDTCNELEDTKIAELTAREVGELHACRAFGL